LLSRDAVNIEEPGATVAAPCSATFKALHILADRFLLGRLQAWRRR
jgi:iron(III) transport system permease protein